MAGYVRVSQARVCVNGLLQCQEPLDYGKWLVIQGTLYSASWDVVLITQRNTAWLETWRHPEARPAAAELL